MTTDADNLDEVGVRSVGMNQMSERDLVAAARLVGPDNVSMLPRLDYLINDLADALERHLAETGLAQEVERLRRIETAAQAWSLSSAAFGPETKALLDSLTPSVEGGTE